MFQELIDALRVQTHNEDTIATPSGVSLVPSELFHLEPKSARGVIRCDSLESLVGYVDTQDNQSAMIFADRSGAKITAVLDWHDPECALWGDHTASMPLQFTQDWIDWSGISGRAIGQRAFAEFIEEHLDCIHMPAAAEILTIATFLEGKRNVKFKNVAVLGNGDRQLQWEETTEAKGVGDVKVPSEITLRIPVYRGAEAETTVELRALFRYRIDDGKLTFEVKLMQADKVADGAFGRVVDGLRELLKTATIIAPVILGNVVTTPRETLAKRIK